MKRNSIYSTIALCLSVSFAYAQQPVPAPPQDKPVLITGATLHIGNGKVLENTSILFDKGKITQIGNAIKGDQAGFNVIDAAGKQVYPGFIALNSILGLTEIEAARATNDYNETGSLNPNVRGLVSYNTDSRVTPTVRLNGVLMAQIAPEGGRLSGQSSVVMLDGWNWEDAAYKADEGLFINWPNLVRIKIGERTPDDDNNNSKTEKDIQDIRALFKDAKAYAQGSNTEKNPRLEAMRGLFNGTKKLYVNASSAKSIESAVIFCKDMGITMVLVGGEESLMVASLLRENNIPVILGRTHNLPSHTDDDVDMPYKMPFLLKKEGILCAISIDGFWQERNLGFNAGTAAAYGLTKEEALQCITSAPAAILGIDKTTGTLEVGKDATLFISTGDALDMRTNNLEHAYMRGKDIQLTSVQTELYKKYMQKYGLK